MAKKKTKVQVKDNYSSLVNDLGGILESARKVSVRSINSILTAAYWLIGYRIAEYELKGLDRTDYYGDKLIEKIAEDLSLKFGRGFSKRNIFLMKNFYLVYPDIFQTLSGKSSIKIVQTLSALSIRKQYSENILQTPSAQSFFNKISNLFHLPWSHYVRLLSVKDEQARKFYETESIRSGWSVRQLNRQISSQFYERTLLSKNKSAMLKKAEKPLPEDLVTPEEEIKDPVILEFLGLKDEYSENDLEEALILHLEKFLLELGGDFAFIGRQKRLRIGSEWYRIGLLFFHRKLRCLVVIDLKVGKFTHADAGQMHLYLNYAKEHWTNNDENPPVGLILCAEKDSAVAKYALEGLPNKVLASEYKLALPDEKILRDVLKKTQKLLLRRMK
ncbi:MAG TPA: PDDEXK nuclease domain-containing protein [Ignavibacteriaceae bacterium]|nr:PDDEXK nuclease domain-containing protein [Ignavibacteriaceae bacterium]